jgi:hypothetical protein
MLAQKADTSAAYINHRPQRLLCFQAAKRVSKAEMLAQKAGTSLKAMRDQSERLSRQDFCAQAQRQEQQEQAASAQVRWLVLIRTHTK